MMIRSAPPASAHLAERPVPAPAPMIGLPASTWARSRASASARGHACTLDQLVEPVGHRDREGVVVDVQLEPCASTPSEPSRGGRRTAPRPPPRRGRRRLRSRSSRRPCSGTKSAVGPVARGQLAADPAAELRALLRRRPHQRHGRVVHVEVPVAELRRHGLERPEVDHVERAERDDLRQARARPPPRAGPGPPRARRRRGRRRAPSSSRRARRRGSRRGRAPPSTGRRCRSRGRRAPRSRAPRAARARASRTAS